ncbi:MAG: pyruvate, phosphate dikinase, partial [Intrasporangiaceae bacterium]|nr:pyruvate, phosphate dikinase [Intrasporangiaceae bacterium]
TDIVIREGDMISLDGTTGIVVLGAVDLVQPELTGDLDTILEWADEFRTLGVRANADNPEDAELSRNFGAQGIGLCRTEHMFLGDRRHLVEELVLANSDEERQEVLDRLLPLQRDDFVELFRAMDGLPVTVRLLDPPLHEFLPDITELSVKVAVADARGEEHDDDTKLLAAVNRLHEENPMLGLRGVRLGIAIPGLFEMQSQAILEAAALVTEEGGSAAPEIMVPLVGAVEELRNIKEEIAHAAHEARVKHNVHLDHLVGTMIELPRAALTAGEIAEAADFFSFGTNDLTQTTWGFSRDDVEASFFSRYLDKGILGFSPFETIDADGVGRLVRIGTDEGRRTKPDLKVGVCGEHGGDPESVRYFEVRKLDYVSCSPFRVPVARLEAARAVQLADANA